MPPSRTLDVGMDGQQASSAGVSVAQDHPAEGVALGHIGTRPCDIDPRSRRLHTQSPPRVVASDASPCGSWLARARPPKGPGWWLVAPAGIPQQPGERLTTPRRDAITRARWRRSGALTHVSVPTGAEDAMRALGRAREEPIGALQAAMLRLTACLLRQDLCSPGRAPWHPAPRRGLRAGDCPTPAPLRVLPEDVRAGTDPTARRPRLAQARPAPGHTWRLQPVVEALQGLRGVPCPVAVTRVAARGDRTRVDTPRPRMRALGLLSADDARGDRRRQGGLPTAGNPHARQARIAGAWASRDPAQVRRQLPL